MTTTTISYSLTDKQDWNSLREKLLFLSEKGVPFEIKKEKGFKRVTLSY